MFFFKELISTQAFQKNLPAIGLNEVTAIEVDENQDAIVFGEFPNYQDYVYIIKANCDTEQAELFTENQTVEWSYGNEAIAMKRKPGKINPTGYINLTNSEGEPDIADFFLGINNGVVAQIPAQIECVFLAASTSQAQESDIKLYNDNMQLRVELPENNYAESLEIFNITGQRIYYEEDQNLIDISSYAPGKYQLIIRIGGKTANQWFSKF